MARFVQASDGASLWTCASGSGSGVLLSSGGPGCCDYMEPVASMIDDLATVVRWEQRGCGRSASVGPFDLDRAILDMEEIRRAFGFDRWAVGGHSWGANLSLAYALRHPQHVPSVICMAGTGFQNDRSWHAAYEAGRTERPERLPDFLYPYNPEVNREGNRSWREAAKHPDLLRKAAEYQGRVLFVCAEKDIRPSWPVEQLAQLMPNALIRFIEGAEHFMQLTHAGELALVLRTFLLSA
jgi:proline iminopeptidase